MAVEVIEHDHGTSGSGAAFWAVVVILVVALALLLFGSNIFGRGGTNNSGTGTDIEGSVNTQ